jgi:hypothetical protein
MEVVSAPAFRRQRNGRAEGLVAKRVWMIRLDGVYVTGGDLDQKPVLLDQAEGARHHVEAERDDDQAHAPGAVFT